MKPYLSACASSKTLQTLLETLELSSHGFILAFNTVAQETQVCKLVISNASWVKALSLLFLLSILRLTNEKDKKTAKIN